MLLLSLHASWLTMVRQQFVRWVASQEELLVGSEIISQPSLPRGKEVKSTVLARAMLRVRDSFQSCAVLLTAVLLLVLCWYSTYSGMVSS